MSSTVMRTARPMLRQSTFAARPQQMQQRQFSQFQQQLRTRFRQQQKQHSNGRRWQSSEASGTQGQSWFKRMWESEVGIKTVHFWAPVMKWALVLAGVSDFARPAEKLSLTQNFALTCTGIIWTRWCLIIKPKNYLLAAVNFFLGIVGLVQCSRIIVYMNSQKGGVTEAIEEAKEEVKDKIKA